MLAQEVRHSSDFHLIAEIQGRTHYKRTFFVNSEKTLKVKKKKKKHRNVSYDSVWHIFEEL